MIKTLLILLFLLLPSFLFACEEQVIVDFKGLNSGTITGYSPVDNPPHNFDLSRSYGCPQKRDGYTQPSFTADTTWCIVLDSDSMLHKIAIHSIDTTGYGNVMLDSGDVICPLVPLFRHPKQPLIPKIDTIRVDIDTVGFEKVGVKIHKNFENMLHWSYTGDCYIDNHYVIDSAWQPVTDTTVYADSLYRLSPAQVKLLGGVK